MNQTGSVFEPFFFFHKSALWHPGSFEVVEKEPHYRQGPHGGAYSQTQFNGSKKEKASRLRDAEWLWRRRPALPLPRIPRHWSQWSHKLLLTLTVNGYKKTPSFLYMTRSPSLRGFVDGSRGCCEWKGMDGECGGRKSGCTLRMRGVWDEIWGDFAAFLAKSKTLLWTCMLLLQGVMCGLSFCVCRI